MTERRHAAACHTDKGEKCNCGLQDRIDAERYRFLRDHANPDDGEPYIGRHVQNSWGKWCNTYDHGKKADERVDAAMAASERLK